MGRAALELGQIGEPTITPVKLQDGGNYVALPPRSRSSAYRVTVYYRQWDGRRRRVARIERTRALAEASAIRAARERLDGMDEGRWTRKTLVVNAARDWLEANTGDGGRLSERTGQVYWSAYKRAIANDGSAIAGLTLEQVNDAQRLRKYLDGVAEKNGTGTAKHVKAVLSGVLKEAVSFRVLPTNELLQVPGVKTVSPKRGSNRDRKRSLTDAEVELLRDTATKRANAEGLHLGTVKERRAVAALVYFMSGTGVRIGEALGLRWEDVNLQTGRVVVHGTKTVASDRILTLPAEPLAYLAEYAETKDDLSGYVFHAPRRNDSEARWDTSNATAALRELFTECGLDWAVGHTFRRTVATHLHNGGIPVNRVADQMGHADASMTARVYLARDLLGDKADLAKVLK